MGHHTLILHTLKFFQLNFCNCPVCVPHTDVCRGHNNTPLFRIFSFENINRIVKYGKILISMVIPNTEEVVFCVCLCVCLFVYLFVLVAVFF